MSAERIYQTTGGLSVEVVDDVILIEQEGLMGEGGVRIDIPRALFPLVIQRVLEQLGDSDSRAVIGAAMSRTGTNPLSEKGGQD